ncbi:MAG: primosomal protein N' [Acidobacteria bacterium]|nr:primosomal protein N' [Acidobacteriota bacterium]
MRFISVAVPVPYLASLTYRFSEPHAALPPVGARVRVPLGSRSVTGLVIAHDADAPEDGEARDVEAVLDREPFLPPSVVALCEWVADYYMSGIGDAIGVALPPGARRQTSSFRTSRVVAATAHGLAALDSGATGAPPLPGRGLTAKQRAALEMLAAPAVGLPMATLRDRGVGGDLVRRLVAHGLAAIRQERDDRDPFEAGAMHAPPLRPVDRDPPLALTAEQEAALDRLSALADAGRFSVALLRGVTGSGKTEIYMRLADRVCRMGKQALVLVPEIALTPSVAARVRAAFGSRVAVQHSALSDGERHDQWHRIRRGEVDVVVGTRSAVFSPLTRLGLVIVDEEHDTSYKQEEAPRYHGRDVAIVRASHGQALVVLGSATPSMETCQHATSGKYACVVLERRVLDRPLASVRLVNMRAEYAEEGPDVVIGRELASAVDDRLHRREQALILLNRRGYATAVFCRQCGDTFECPNCSVSLTVHRARAGPPRAASKGWTARCHYCNYAMTVPAACRKCAAPYLEQAGFGTEKVEQHLRERFPDARIARLDRDAVRRRGALASLLSRFAAGEIDVLVGTQMIAKGHDFPRVTLVGVISADVGLGLADFRAAERTFQLLTQVAGRAGRGERAGEAIVQTLYPEHYSIQLACRQDYPAFFERELAYRRAMRYPPVVALVNVIVRGRTFAAAMHTATDLAHALGPSAARGGFAVLGPAPAPLVRLRGEHRVQFFLKGARRADMREALKAALAAMPHVRRRATVDVDPVSIL